MKLSDIAMIGIGVMGENLVLNMEKNGFSVVVYDISQEKINKFINGRASGKNISGTTSLQELAQKIVRPRKLMMMVPAGKIVDQIIDQLIPYLEPGDIVIDGGNSHFPDSIRRAETLEKQGFYFIGAGISGGEEGALNGPSIMPAGSPKAWEFVKPVFQSIAAKVDGNVPCCDWVGENGAGHFVKMVHNGIEYGDMQLICEVYHLMKDLLHLDYDTMNEIFSQWNEGELNSYLVEITRDILAYKDTDGEPLVEKILDTAGQKGTGKWTVISSLDVAAPLTLIGEAVFARILSGSKEERVEASKSLPGPNSVFQDDKKEFVEDLKNALYLAKIVSYAQGYVLMRQAANEYKWNLNYGGIALMWRGGCIIRSAFLGKIKDAFDNDPGLKNLMLDPFFRSKMEQYHHSWRRVVSAAAMNGMWTPALSSALNYYDGFRNGRLPINLLQAQRDFFGAHNYERTDRPRGEFFHTNWTGEGGDTASGVYSA